MQVLQSSHRSASPTATASRDTTSRQDALLRDIDAWHASACNAQRQFLGVVAEADRCRVWESSGARDMVHWLRMRYGISDWKARRFIDASHALESLPLTSEAFSSGRLGVDKVVELTRVVTFETERDLLPWAGRV